MNYADNQYKFVAVLNKRIPLAQLLNALAHTASGLSSTTPVPAVAPDGMAFRVYRDADDTPHPAISTYPYIILEAKNGNQLRTLRQGAREGGLLYNDFVDTMIGSSSDEQMAHTRATPEAALEYWCVCVFGPSERIDALTRKFSLFKTPVPNANPQDAENKL